MDSFQQILFALKEIEDDSSTPKNVKLKIASTIKVLNEDSEKSIKVSKALHTLEDLADDMNMQADTRMQIFNIVSQLEVV